MPCWKNASAGFDRAFTVAKKHFSAIVKNHPELQTAENFMHLRQILEKAERTTVNCQKEYIQCRRSGLQQDCHILFLQYFQLYKRGETDDFGRAAATRWKVQLNVTSLFIDNFMFMLLDILLLIGGFGCLIYGADFLVDGGAALARLLKVPAMVIGLTIVAFGTSAPELVVNVVSAIEGSSGLAMGNVLGSNIFNILAILGVTALIIPLGVKGMTTWIEIPLALFAAVLILLQVIVEPAGRITRAEGICLLCFFVAFLAYTLALAKYGKPEGCEGTEIKNLSAAKSVLFILLGLAGLIGGGRLLVYAAVSIAANLGLSERIIGLTIVSVGTSLPELATSVIAARKKNSDIAIGNIIGSNIFNTFLILGVSVVITPMEVPMGSLADLIVNTLAAGLLFAFIFIGKSRKINRPEGAVFLLLYIAYLAFILYKTA